MVAVMSDGLSDFVRMARESRLPDWDSDLYRPVVPRRVTEYGRLMWAADLGLPSNNTPPYFWLGREAEA